MTVGSAAGQVIWEVIILAGSGRTCPNALWRRAEDLLWCGWTSAVLMKQLDGLHLHPLCPVWSADNASMPRSPDPNPDPAALS